MQEAFRKENSDQGEKASRVIGPTSHSSSLNAEIQSANALRYEAILSTGPHLVYLKKRTANQQEAGEGFNHLKQYD